MNWHNTLAVAALTVTAAGTSAWAQSPHIITPPDQIIAVKAGHLFDSRIGDMLDQPGDSDQGRQGHRRRRQPADFLPAPR